MIDTIKAWLKGEQISVGTKSLAEAIVNKPDNWKQGAYYFSCISQPSVSIWTANGWSSISLEGNKAFNKKEQKFLNEAIIKCLAKQVLSNEQQQGNNCTRCTINI